MRFNYTLASQLIINGFAGIISKLDLFVIIGYSILFHTLSIAKHSLIKSASYRARALILIIACFQSIFISIASAFRSLAGNNIYLLTKSSGSGTLLFITGVLITSLVTFKMMFLKMKLDK